MNEKLVKAFTDLQKYRQYTWNVNNTKIIVYILYNKRNTSSMYKIGVPKEFHRPLAKTRKLHFTTER